MNVKPGDLAIVTRGGCMAAAANEGRIVEVLCPFPMVVEGAFSWWVKGRMVMPDGRQVETIGIKDCGLRPLRDPGDDAVDHFARPKHDETLIPKRQLEHAR